MDFKKKIEVLQDCEKIVLKILENVGGIIFEKITNDFAFYISGEVVLLFRGDRYYSSDLVDCIDHHEMIDTIIPLLEHYIIEKI
jgi:hypothetical protein